VLTTGSSLISVGDCSLFVAEQLHQHRPCCGVPQGSVFGPFLLYTAVLLRWIRSHRWSSWKHIGSSKPRDVCHLHQRYSCVDAIKPTRTDLGQDLKTRSACFAILRRIGSFNLLSCLFLTKPDCGCTSSAALPERQLDTQRQD
jgi:hypothetical protein